MWTKKFLHEGSLLNKESFFKESKKQTKKLNKNKKKIKN